MDNLKSINHLIFGPPGGTELADKRPSIIKDGNLNFLYLDKFSKSTLVCFHGNGESVFDFYNYFSQLFELTSSNILIMEYRGFGVSTGTQNLENLLDDVSELGV